VSSTYGYALALLASALWGLTYCLDQRLLESLSAPRVYLLHAASGLAMISAVLLVQGRFPTDASWLRATGISGWFVAATMAVSMVASLAIFGSIQLLGASKAAVLEISYPLFVALFALLLFRQPLETPVLVGGLFIFVGSTIIVLSG